MSLKLNQTHKINHFFSFFIKIAIAFILFNSGCKKREPIINKKSSQSSATVSHLSSSSTQTTKTTNTKTTISTGATTSTTTAGLVKGLTELLNSVLLIKDSVDTTQDTTPVSAPKAPSFDTKFTIIFDGNRYNLKVKDTMIDILSASFGIGCLMNPLDLNNQSSVNCLVYDSYDGKDCQGEINIDFQSGLPNSALGAFFPMNKTAGLDRQDECRNRFNEFMRMPFLKHSSQFGPYEIIHSQATASYKTKNADGKTYQLQFTGSTDIKLIKAESDFGIGCQVNTDSSIDCLVYDSADGAFCQGRITLDLKFGLPTSPVGFNDISGHTIAVTDVEKKAYCRNFFSSFRQMPFLSHAE